jgi:CRP-like cAMP-binding protein
MNAELTYLSVRPFLQDVRHAFVRDIYSRATREKFHRNRVVFREGDECGDMYIIRSGEFSIYKSYEFKSPDN